MIREIELWLTNLDLLVTLITIDLEFNPFSRFL